MSVTDALRRSAFDAETDEVWLVLLTIDHADLSAPIRVVNNEESITSNGVEYIAFPFDIRLPDSTQDSPPQAQITIDNVSLEITQALRTISSPADVHMQVIRASDPDTVELTFPDFKLRDASWNVLTVSGALLLEDFVQEPYPAEAFTPAQFPGLF